MANHTVTQATTRVTVDGKQAQQELTILTNKAEQLRKELDELIEDGKGGTKEVERITVEWTRTVKQIEKVKRTAVDVDKVLANLSTAGPREVQRALRQLHKEINSGRIARGSKEWDEHIRKIKLLQAEARKMKSEMSLEKQGGNMFSRMADGFNRYFGLIAGGIASLTGMTFALRKMSEEAARLDDTYSDVMKTTGMTRQEVVELNKEFDKLNTRTSREELNLLARDAGKLNIKGSKDVLQFVDAANMIKVALGEDLGEDAIKQIGKMADIYAKSSEEISNQDLRGKMLAVGSAVNTLGASSTANESYLVQFANRLSGVSAQANIGIGSILGYASALDQNAQAVEMSATAFQNFIQKMFADPAKFANMAGIEVGKFSQLLKTDANQAIKSVLLALSQKGGFQALIPMFKDMGMDGSRAVGVLSSMASSMDKIEEAQRLASASLREGSSVIEEYNVKNNNAQAKLEKAREAMSDAAIALGERLNPALLKTANWTTMLIRLLPSLLDFVQKYGRIIIWATTVIGTYVAAIKLQELWGKRSIAVTKAKILWTNAQALAEKAATVVKLAFTAAINGTTIAKGRAIVAWRALTAAMKANPYGLLLTAIVALLPLMGKLYDIMRGHNKQLEEARKHNKAVKEVTDEYTASIAQEQSKLTSLMAVLMDANSTTEQRASAIKEIRAQYPQYLHFLDLERASVNELATSLRIVNDLYQKKYRLAGLKAEAKVHEDELTALHQEKARLEKEQEDRINEANANRIKQGRKALSVQEVNTIRKEYSGRLRQLDNDIKRKTADMNHFVNKAEKEQQRLDRMNSSKGIEAELTDRAKELQALQKQKQKAEQEWDYAKFKASAAKNKRYKGLYEQNADKAEARIKQLDKLIGERQEEYSKMQEVMGIKQQEEFDAKNTPKPASDGITPAPASDSSKGGESAADKARKGDKERINNALATLQKTYNEKIAEINEQFRKGEITSEAELEEKLLELTRNYNSQQIEALKGLHLATEEGKTEASEKIAEINRKASEEEVERLKELRKIILQADPIKAEQYAYEERLRKLGLFGKKKEEMTRQEQEALEILLSQHLQRMQNLEKPQVTKKLKEIDSREVAERNRLAMSQALMDEERFEQASLMITIAYASERLRVEGITAEQRLQAEKDIQEALLTLRKKGVTQDTPPSVAEQRDNALSYLDSLFPEHLQNEEAYQQARMEIIKYYNLLEKQEHQRKQAEMMKAAEFALDHLQGLMGAYTSYVQASASAEEAIIRAKYDREIEAAGNNQARIRRIEKRRDAELKAKQKENAERSYNIQIAMAMAGAIQSAINAYSSTAAIPIIGPAAAPIAAATALAAGMLNVMGIRKQKEAAMAEFYSGGYTAPGGKYDVAGVVHAGEFVGNAQAVQNPTVKRVFDVVDKAQRTNTVGRLRPEHFAQALEYRERVAGIYPASDNAQATQGANNELLQPLANAIAELSVTQRKLHERLQEPFESKVYMTGPNGIVEQTKLYNQIKRGASRQ